jgi:hypothetical protein
MGTGVAKLIKEKVPNAYENYLKSERILGTASTGYNDDYFVFNLITQEYFGNDFNIRYVSYDAVDQCFSRLNSYCKIWNITELAIPKIGAGKGNGNWEVIEAIINYRMNGIKILCYEL